MSIPFESIKQASLAHATRLLPEWFPYGKLSGREFEVGSLQGERGKSLKINIDTGLWKDFATGECGGDLIDLRAAITRETLAEAATSLAASLGVQVTNGNGNGHAAHNAWTPIIPPPTGTEPPHTILRQFDTVYEYTNANDRVTHYVGRTERGNGSDRKLFTPITYGVLNGAKGWHRKGPTAPRPLYGLNRLASMPQATVIVCEGEKAADAAQRMLPDYACVAWSNGAEAWSKSDWSPLAGRKVIVWPDNDAPGHKAAKALAPGIFAKILRVDDLPESADAADVEVDEDWIRHRLHDQPPQDGLPLVYIEDIEPNLDAADFIEDTLIEGSMAVVYGESNCGKTFFMTDLAIHVALGKEWRGKEIEKGGVIYCALEGSHGILNRVSAFKKQYNLEVAGIPFAVIPYSINMLDKDVDRLIEAIERAAARFDYKVKLIVIDTLSRALAGGNENAPDDMGALVTSTDRVRQETGACVAYVHHSGKDAAKGARGHSLLRAATDTEIEVAREDINSPSVATVTKQREMEISGKYWFKLDPVTLGTNRRGKPVTSCVVMETDAGQTTGHDRTKDAKLPDGAALGVRALISALSKSGAKLPPTKDYPHNTMAVSHGMWREEFYQLKSGTKDTQIRAFSRAEDTLLARKVITQRNGLVWLVKPDNDPTKPDNGGQ